ncbi:MAG: glycosyltransferase [Bacteroidota bacterium]
MSADAPSVLLVNLSKSWGGGEKWFFTCSKELIEERWNVRLITYKNSQLSQRLKESNIPHDEIKLASWSMLNPFKLTKVRNLISAFNPSYLLLNSSVELKVVGLAGKWASVPHILLRRGLSFPFKNNFVNHWYISRILTGFMANSYDVWKPFVERFPQTKALEHTIIPNGVDTRFYQPELQQKHHIGIVARLSPEKGIDMALRAFAIVRANFPEAHLHIWGIGDEGIRLIELSQELGVEEEVTFHGFHHEVTPLLARCGIFVLPSNKGEGTSNALIEAMSVGIPAVAFDVPSMRETIIHEETGLIVDSYEAKSLANALKKLMNDENLRQNLGKGARKRAVEVYAQQHATVKLMNWLQGLT